LPEFKSQIKTILEGAINFLSGISYNENCLSLYPSTISLNNQKNFENSRLGWCYGDLGIAIVLLQSSNLLKSEILRKKALHILTFSSKRKSLEKNLVFDSGVCHGAMGISHIFHNVNIKNSNSRYQDAAQYWLNKGMDLLVYDDNYNGIKKWNHLSKTLTPDNSLLEGAAGVGLVIISSIMQQNQTNKWDECLMLN
jgi:lantibiotic modifying enzyme